MTKNIITALIGIGLAYILVQSPQFQKAFYPARYWGQEISNMADIVSYDKVKVMQTQQKIDLYSSDDLPIVQKLEIEILISQLHAWKVMLAADEKRLELMIENSAK